MFVFFALVVLAVLYGVGYAVMDKKITQVNENFDFNGETDGP